MKPNYPQYHFRVSVALGAILIAAAYFIWPEEWPLAACAVAIVVLAMLDERDPMREE